MDGDKMSEEKNIDIESFRSGMRPLSERIRESLKNFVSGLFHRNWVEVEAEVRECTPIRPSSYTPRYQVLPKFVGYVVTFSYSVDGRKYEGITNSPDEVKPLDRFAIRYNPRQPGENNTFDSETDWTTTYSKYFTIIGILLLLFLLIRKHFFGE